MIKNSLKYTKNYYKLSENIKLGLKFLEDNDLETFENGKYEILGQDVFVNIQDYETKPENQCKWEAHRKYIDIQFIIKGIEKVGVGEIQDYTTTEVYNEKKDVEFFETQKTQNFIELKENEYIILYPYDVHKPQICNNMPSYVKKAVVKVSIN